MACQHCFKEVKEAAEKGLGKVMCPYCGGIWALIVAEMEYGLLRYLPKDKYYWKEIANALTDCLVLTEEDIIHLGRS